MDAFRNDIRDVSAGKTYPARPITRRNVLLHSHKRDELAQAFFDEPVILGIDEAGRGPVLGYMVYGAAMSIKSRSADLIKLAFDDSKKLSLDQRNTSLERVHSNSDFISWIADPISPYYLSSGMLSKKKYNLNEISHDSAINLIRRALSKGINVTDVFVDTVGPPASYQRKLAAIFPGINIVVETKADSKFPIVSAASIVAKTLRDELLENYSFTEPDNTLCNKDVGSGYPSGPAKDWVVKNHDPIFGFPDIVRFGWSTAYNIISAKGPPADMYSDVSDLEEDDVATHAMPKKSSITTAKPTKNNNKRIKLVSQRKTNQRTNYYKRSHLSLFDCSLLI